VRSRAVLGLRYAGGAIARCLPSATPGPCDAPSSPRRKSNGCTSPRAALRSADLSRARVAGVARDGRDCPGAAVSRCRPRRACRRRPAHGADRRGAAEEERRALRTRSAELRGALAAQRVRDVGGAGEQVRSRNHAARSLEEHSGCTALHSRGFAFARPCWRRHRTLTMTSHTHTRISIIVEVPRSKDAELIFVPGTKPVLDLGSRRRRPPPDRRRFWAPCASGLGTIK